MTQLIPLPGCRLVRVARDGPTALTLVAEAKPDHARCPTCRAISTSVHSRYRRRPADLPASGKAVRLQLEVRRFYCCDPACPRRTFAERFPKLLARHAQRTRRLAGAQARTGLALGGQPAARLLAHLAMPSSATTLLRTIRGVPLPKAPRPCVVGVDDWALRKGRTYGTIVVDLERHRPLDLLPDRSAETWVAWLRRQPQIRLVARDRSTEYARGTTLGAPAAVQVADRWHLLLNTRQMIERWLARVHPRLKLLPPITAPAPSTRRTRAYPRAPAETLARAAAVGRWEELYDDVRRRRAAGQSLRLINRETGLARATVRKYAFAEGFPRHDGRGPGRSILDPHLDHLHARQAAGCENAMQLWRELRDRGFPGTVKQVRRWLSERRTRPARTTIWRLKTPSPMAQVAPPSPPLPSPKQLSWHLLREPDDLDADAAAVVARVLQDDEAAKVVGLGRRFCRIVRSRCGAAPAKPGITTAFDAWLSDARACGVRVVESFAVSLAQDGAAVRAGLRLPWSSGQDEGQVNRLKLLKRSMYGRAKLDLLRRRFLLAA
ncbi:ISL3-like element ISMex10 family transposase [Methylobacterium brachiatum]|uniref:ISL3-like element ISMex10 family transposase n=1 Tax=Methylobacterium brachiatum TaxID=269660 RepID=UPI000EFC1486|nr:ISL3-like element ISMex10 family transposase [Methylobacterium brachiatum]AYO86427.1 ISL3-like element ISMex10 family transposase [Methylobacterium brachiatum]